MTVTARIKHHVQVPKALFSTQWRPHTNLGRFNFNQLPCSPHCSFTMFYHIEPLSGLHVSRSAYVLSVTRLGLAKWRPSTALLGYTTSMSRRDSFGLLVLGHYRGQGSTSESLQTSFGCILLLPSVFSHQHGFCRWNNHDQNIAKTLVQLYCWWKKSCTSWYVVYSTICRALYIPGGARFRPSTVFQPRPKMKSHQKMSCQIKSNNINSCQIYECICSS